MTFKTYEFFKNRYESTKPIRGRDKDIRPISRRRRDWEKVVKYERADGVWYGAQLYDTNVVMCSPDGRLELNVGGWATVSTAEFMHIYSPFRATKTRNHIWVALGDQKVPIPNDRVTTFKQVGDKWELTSKIELKQRVVDRSKSKAIRERVKGFEKYATTLLKLSDGWVRADTIAQWRSLDEDNSNNSYRWKRYVFDFGFEKNITQILSGHTLSKWHREENNGTYKAYLRDLEVVLNMLSVEDIDTWDRAMYCILERASHVQQVGVNVIEYKPFSEDKHTMKLTLNDHQYSVSVIKNFISKLIKQMDVYTTRDVDTSCIRDNIVI